MKGIFFSLLLMLSCFTIFGQEVTLKLKQSAGGCGLATNCDNNIICVDIELTSDISANIDAYNIFVHYNSPTLNTITTDVISRKDGGSDMSCVASDVTDTELENAGVDSEDSWRVTADPGIAGSNSVVANVPKVIHTICFEVKDEANLKGHIIEVGGSRFSGAIQTTFKFESDPGEALEDNDIPRSQFTFDENFENCSLLPVELTSFDVEKTDETTLVSWSTATEINNDYFNVERSKDGVRFETIGTVQGNGTTTDRMTYSFEDENPMGGVNYYRLKQVDYDGAYEYSDIKSVRFDGKMGVNVTMGLYPNPANDHVTVELDGIKLHSNTTVRVFDKIGKLVMVTDLNTNNQVDISELVDGMYMIQAINNDAIIATKKLVKASSF